MHLPTSQYAGQISDERGRGLASYAFPGEELPDLSVIAIGARLGLSADEARRVRTVYERAELVGEGDLPNHISNRGVEENRILAGAINLIRAEGSEGDLLNTLARCGYNLRAQLIQAFAMTPDLERLRTLSEQREQVVALWRSAFPESENPADLQPPPIGLSWHGENPAFLFPLEEALSTVGNVATFVTSAPEELHPSMLAFLSREVLPDGTLLAPEDVWKIIQLLKDTRPLYPDTAQAFTRPMTEGAIHGVVAKHNGTALITTLRDAGYVITPELLSALKTADGDDPRWATLSEDFTRVVSWRNQPLTGFVAKSDSVLSGSTGPVFAFPWDERVSKTSSFGQLLQTAPKAMVSDLVGAWERKRTEIARRIKNHRSVFLEAVIACRQQSMTREELTDLVVGLSKIVERMSNVPADEAKKRLQGWVPHLLRCGEKQPLRVEKIIDAVVAWSKARPIPDGEQQEIFSRSVEIMQQACRDTEDLSRIFRIADEFCRHLPGIDLPAALERAVEYTRRFGISPPRVIGEYVTLCEGAPASDEGLGLGITATGSAGVSQLEAAVKELTRQLLVTDASPAVQGDLASELVGVLTRTGEAQFGMRTRLADVVRVSHQHATSATFRSTPHWLTRGDFRVATSGDEKGNGFEITKESRERFKFLRNSLNEVRGKESDTVTPLLRTELTAGISKALAEIELLSPAQQRFHDARRQRLVLARQALTGQDSAEILSSAVAGNLSLEEWAKPMLTRAIMSRCLSLPQFNFDLSFLDQEQGTVATTSSMVDLVSSYLAKELFPGVVQEPALQKELRVLLGTKGLQDDLARFHRTSSGRTEVWEALPTRGLLLNLSGSICDACWASQENIAAAHPNISAVIFGAGLETSSPNLRGAVLLIEARSTAGEPVLVVRGLNSLNSRLKQLRPDSFVDALLDWLQPRARAGGFAFIVAPDDQQSNGSQTNRPALHAVLKERLRGGPRVSLAEEPRTSFNGYEIANPCAVLRDVRTRADTR